MTLAWNPCASGGEIHEAARTTNQAQTELSKKSLQLGVFGLGLLEDGDVGVGVFPEPKEILVGGASFGRIALKRVGARE
jgi:hypothetical protein